MTNTLHNVRFVIIACLAMTMLLLIPEDCGAQGASRQGRWEVFGLLQQMDGDSTSDGATDVEVDDTAVGGLGVGYHFNEHIAVNLDLWLGQTDIEYGAFLIDADMLGLDFNVDYHILDRPLTPLVTAGIGFIHFDGETAVLGLGYEETDFSYNLGAGFRWDIGDHFFAKALYRLTWTELEDTDDTITLDGVTLGFGAAR